MKTRLITAVTAYCVTVMMSQVVTKFPLLNLMMLHHFAHVRDDSDESAKSQRGDGRETALKQLTQSLVLLLFCFIT